jgi:GGDEF domain-containing protein
MLPEVASAEEAGVVAQKVRECFADPYRLDGRDVGVSASVGTALLSAGAGDCSDLIREADTAMYLSKASRSAPPRAPSLRPVTHTANQ